MSTGTATAPVGIGIDDRPRSHAWLPIALAVLPIALAAAAITTHTTLGAPRLLDWATGSLRWWLGIGLDVALALGGALLAAGALGYHIVIRRVNGAHPSSGLGFWSWVTGLAVAAAALGIAIGAGLAAGAQLAATVARPTRSWGSFGLDPVMLGMLGGGVVLLSWIAAGSGRRYGARPAAIAALFTVGLVATTTGGGVLGWAVGNDSVYHAALPTGWGWIAVPASGDATQAKVAAGRARAAFASDTDSPGAVVAAADPVPDATGRPTRGVVVLGPGCTVPQAISRSAGPCQITGPTSTVDRAPGRVLVMEAATATRFYALPSPAAQQLAGGGVLIPDRNYVASAATTKATARSKATTKATPATSAATPGSTATPKTPARVTVVTTNGAPLAADVLIDRGAAPTALAIPFPAKGRADLFAGSAITSAPVAVMTPATATKLGIITVPIGALADLRGDAGAIDRTETALGPSMRLVIEEGYDASTARWPAYLALGAGVPLLIAGYWLARRRRRYTRSV